MQTILGANETFGSLLAKELKKYTYKIKTGEPESR